METKKNPAKELGNKRSIFLMIGAICSLSIAIGALSWSQPEVKPAKLTNPNDQIYKGDNELPPVTQPDKQPLDLRQITAMVNPDIMVVVPNNTPKPIVVEFPDVNELPTIATPGTTYGTGKPGNGRGGHEPQLPDDTPVLFAEEFPTYNGRDGQTAFSEWCQENLKYPLAAVENGAQGKVYISFIVEANGKLSNVEVARSSGSKALDNAALEVVTKAPARWKAARNNNRPVRFQYLMPVEFQLEQQ